MGKVVMPDNHPLSVAAAANYGDSLLNYGDSLLDALASGSSPHILNLDAAPLPQALSRRPQTQSRSAIRPVSRCG
jgi:hypothetical protein